MEKFNVHGAFTNIAVYSNLNYRLIPELEKQFLQYLTITEFNDGVDYSICILNNNFNMDFIESLNGYDICISRENKKVYTVVPGEFSKDNIIYIKRLIESLRNRILESKGTLFLHGAAISIGGKSAVFIGDKNVGKTTTILNYLASENAKYVSNDRVALIKENGTTKVLGSPTNIGVRIKTIQDNVRLRSKFSLEEIKKAKYDSETRMALSVQQLKKKLKIEEDPISDLQWIFYLERSKDGHISIENLEKDEVIERLAPYIVNGVFKKNSILNDTLDVSRVNLNELIDNNINSYMLVQDKDCTTILKEIFSKKTEKERKLK